MIAVMAKSGLRVSEVCQLRWRSVDLHHKRLLVEQSKTDAGVREVDLSLDLLDELLAWRAESAPDGVDTFVFATAGGPAAGQGQRSRACPRARDQKSERGPSGTWPPVTAEGDAARAAADVHQPDARGRRPAPVRDGPGRPSGLEDDARDLRPGAEAGQSNRGASCLRRAARERCRCTFHSDGRSPERESVLTRARLARGPAGRSRPVRARAPGALGASSECGRRHVIASNRARAERQGRSVREAGRPARAGRPVAFNAARTSLAISSKAPGHSRNGPRMRNVTAQWPCLQHAAGVAGRRSQTWSLGHALGHPASLAHPGIRSQPITPTQKPRKSEASEYGHGWFRTSDLSRVKRGISWRLAC